MFGQRVTAPTCLALGGAQLHWHAKKRIPEVQPDALWSKNRLARTCTHGLLVDCCSLDKVVCLPTTIACVMCPWSASMSNSGLQGPECSCGSDSATAAYTSDKLWAQPREQPQAFTVLSNTPPHTWSLWVIPVRQRAAHTLEQPGQLAQPQQCSAAGMPSASGLALRAGGYTSWLCPPCGKATCLGMGVLTQEAMQPFTDSLYYALG